MEVHKQIQLVNATEKKRNQRKKENTAMGGEAYGLQSVIIRNMFWRPGRKTKMTRCEEPMLRLKTGLFSFHLAINS